MGKSIGEFHLVADSFAVPERSTREMESERNIVVDPEDELLPSKLNPEQRYAFDLILQSVFSSEGKAFFIDGPGGTGKTFLYRSLLSALRSQGYIAIAVATSGVAASILPGGRTAHSRFKIPLDFSNNKTCQLSKQSSIAKLICESKLILWDEASMAKRQAIEAFNSLLQDLKDSNLPFGGHVVVFGGDFRQTLPVIEQASEQDLIESSLLSSPLWLCMHKLTLKANMRALLNPGFSDFLLRIGEGREPADENGDVTLPSDLVIPYHDKHESLDRMSEILPMKAILPGTKNWTCKVTVQEKQHVTSSLATPTKKQKFIFLDSEGSLVEGIIFNNDIPRMSPLLQWVISTRTLVEEVNDDEDVVPVKLTYTKFTDLIKYMDIKDQSVDILAVVISALDRKQITKDGRESSVQKFVLVNEEFQTVKLSMWDAFVDDEGQKILQSMLRFPVVVCRRVRVGCYNGVALSTWFDSVILVDPLVQEARELKNWAMRNEKLLLDIVNHKVYENYNPELSFQPNQKFTQVCNLTGIQKAVWVKVRFSFGNIFQRYWYMACSECFRSTSAMHGVTFLCNSCKEKHSTQPRCRFDVDLADETGTVTASIFGDLAENLLTFTAAEAMDHFSQNIELQLDHVHESLKTKWFVAHIKPVQSQIADAKQRYTIIYCCEETEYQTEQHLITQESSMVPLTSTNIESAETIVEGSSSSKRKLCLLNRFNDTGTDNSAALQLIQPECTNSDPAKKARLE